MPAWSKVGAFVLTLGFAGPVAAAEPPASVRQFRLDTVVEQDGTAVQTLHIETAVSNDDAARREAQQPMSYSDGLEKLELVEAYTQKPDGRRISVERNAVRTQLAPGVPNLPAYSDRKQMVVVMPDAAGGDLLVATWRRTVLQPLFPGEFAQTSFFIRTTPWNNVEVTTTTPADKPLRTEARDGPVLDETTDNGGRHVYHWRYSAPAVTEDPAALSPLDRAPRLFAATFPDWVAFSRAYAVLFAPQVAVTPRIQAIADEVTAGTTDRRGQAQRLYEWVGQHVRWVAIYLGNGGFVPHAADAVLANGYGDCKDQVALLVALLAAKGIEARPVLINLGPSYTLSGPATYSAFNHVITYLPEWGLYADTTPSGAPFGTLQLPEYGKPILPVTAAGELPSRLPALPPGLASERLHTAAVLGTDGTVSGTSTIEGHGPYATALRLVGRASRAQGAEQFAAAQLRNLNESGQGSVALPETDTLGLDYRIEGRFTLDAHPGWLEGDSFMVPTGLRLLTRTGDGLIGPVHERKLPVAEPTPCYAGRQEEDLSLAFPPGYHPSHLPKDATVAGSFFRYESRWAFADDTVTVHRSLVSTLDQFLCEGGSRAEAAKAWASIRRDLDARIDLKSAE